MKTKFILKFIAIIFACNLSAASLTERAVKFHDEIKVLTKKYESLLFKLELCNANVLMDAIKNDDDSAVKLLIDAGFFDVNFKALGNYPLKDAIFFKKPKLAKLLLNAGANPNVTAYYSNDSMLILAIIFHDPNDDADCTMIKLLLSNHANVNQQNIHGETPLMIAASLGYINIVKLLLDANANCLIQDIKGCRAHEIVAEKLQYEEFRDRAELKQIFNLIFKRYSQQLREQNNLRSRL